MKRYLLAMILGAGMGAAGAAQPLRIITSNFPPYAVESGPEAPGPLARLSLAVITRSGRTGQVEFQPWPRAQLSTARDSDALIIPLVRSAEREAKYQWIGKIYCRSMGFVALRERMPRFDEEALATARLAVLRATPYRASLKPENVREATSFEDMAKMLSLGMVDAIYGSQETIVLALRARGVESAALALSGLVESDVLWLAASPAMPGATVEELGKALRALEKDGSMERILDQGGLARPSCPVH